MAGAAKDRRFITDAAGTYVRARLRGVDDPQRRDFVATFQANRPTTEELLGNLSA
jgi:hypothetical protein